MNTPYFHTCNIIKWKIGGLENEENVMYYAEPDYGSGVCSAVVTLCSHPVMRAVQPAAAPVTSK